MNSETSNSPARRFALIGTLYVSQAIPLGFFIVAVPAILRSRGASLENVGLLAALALPWLVKFLWAPLLDRFGSNRFGHYRSWIVPLQMLCVLCVIAIGVIGLEGNFVALLLAGGAFMLLSATQDVATDGLAVRTLANSQRGAGNGIQVGGYYLGQILGGGVVLVLFGRFGWTLALLAMALFLSLPLIPAAGFREPSSRGRTPERVDFGAIGRFFSRPGATSWIVILLLYRAGETMAITMLNPMLVDRGFSLETIGLLLGIVGSIAACGGALCGGLLVNRVGRKLSLVAFGLLQTAAVAGFLFPAAGIGGQTAIYAAAAVMAFTGGMATAALYTNMMDRSSEVTAATDFTVQQSLCAIGPVVGASLSGFIAGAWGYSTHFMVCLGLNLLCVLIVFRWLAPPAPQVLLAQQPSESG